MKRSVLDGCPVTSQGCRQTDIFARKESPYRTGAGGIILVVLLACCARSRCSQTLKKCRNHRTLFCRCIYTPKRLKSSVVKKNILAKRCHLFGATSLRPRVTPTHSHTRPRSYAPCARPACPALPPPLTGSWCERFHALRRGGATTAAVVVVAIRGGGPWCRTSSASRRSGGRVKS